jgi:hypothetical protein
MIRLAAAILFAVGIGTYVMIDRTRSRPESDGSTFVQGGMASEADRWPADLQRLRAGADLSAQVVKRTEASRRNRLRTIQIRRAELKPEPVSAVRAQMDGAAFLMVRHADRMYEELGLTASAIREYRRVLELFPDSRWARTARERLASLEQEQGDQT